MGEDRERIRRVARAICEQALFELWRVPPDPQEVERRSAAFTDQARAALSAADGDRPPLEEARRTRAAWGMLLLGDAAP